MAREYDHVSEAYSHDETKKDQKLRSEERQNDKKKLQLETSTDQQEGTLKWR